MTRDDEDRWYLEAVDAARRAVQRAPGQRLSRSALQARLADLYDDHPDGSWAAPSGDEIATRAELSVVGREGAELVWGLHVDDDRPIDIRDKAILGRWVDNDTAPKAASLQSARFCRYRSLLDVTLELGDLTVLVGANGVGKSNLLDGLFRANLLTSRRPDVVFSGDHAAERVTTRDAEAPFALEQRGTGGWGFRYDARTRDVTPLDAGKPALRNPLFTPLAAAFGIAARLRLSAAELARPSFTEEEEPYLRQDGRHLASVLDAIAGTDRARLDAIVDAVRQVVPQVQDVRTPRRRFQIQVTEYVQVGERLQAVERPRDVVGNELQVKVKGAGWLPADQISEGTLTLLGLHTALNASPSPSLLLIDDVHRGLHPNAQQLLVEQLLAVAGPRRRVVCTSHSPFVLDPLPADAVRIVQLDPHGHTLVGTLTDHPEWPRWEGSMTAAEFWLYAGDTWLSPPA